MRNYIYKAYPNHLSRHYRWVKVYTVMNRNKNQQTERLSQKDDMVKTKWKVRETAKQGIKIQVALEHISWYNLRARKIAKNEPRKKNKKNNSIIFQGGP